MRRLLIICLTIVGLAAVAEAHPFMGEYSGVFYPDRVTEMKAKAYVMGEGDSVYRLIIEAIPSGNLPGKTIEIYGVEEGPSVLLFGRSDGYHWAGQIKNGHLSASSKYHQHFELDKANRRSPNAGAEPPENAIVLLPFEEGQAPDLSAWTNQEWEVLEDGSMRVVPGKGSSKTVRKFSDIKHFHMEFKLPYEPTNLLQHRANSGVFFNENYEVQILDSFGLGLTSGDCGAIYNLVRARINASLPPETWQTYDITFKAPRMDDSGKVIELPRISVIFNGVKVHDNREIPFSTYNDEKPHKASGSIELQDHGHRIQFRNIWLVEGE